MEYESESHEESLVHLLKWMSKQERGFVLSTNQYQPTNQYQQSDPLYRPNPNSWQAVPKEPISDRLKFPSHTCVWCGKELKSEALLEIHEEEHFDD